MQDFFEVYFDRYIPEPMSGCWLWFRSATTAGYGNFTRFGKTHYAHRCAFEAVNGSGSADGLVIRHQCDNPPCVNPDHLLSGTTQDNVNDAWRRGRMNPARGEGSANVILTEELVLRSRKLARDGMPICDVAVELAVDRNTIDYAVKGLTWAHLPGAVTNPVKAGFRTEIKSGENGHNAKLTQSQVDSIRAALLQGQRGTVLAAIYGVSPVTISAIKTRRIWG